MPLDRTTVKRLFVKSGNRCAFPGCGRPLVCQDTVEARICHIRSWRRKSPRFDPALRADARETVENLLLICLECHLLIEEEPRKYGAPRLAEIKERHERAAAPEATLEAARQADLIYEKFTFPLLRAFR